MAGEETPPLRASDDDRERTLAVLRDASVDGRLTVEELAERAELVHSARSHDELAAVTADLASPAPAAAPIAQKPNRERVILSSIDRRGRWRLAPVNRFSAIAGSVTLDLREALLPGPEIEVEVLAVLGSVDLLVPDGVEVELAGGGTFMSSRDVEATGPAAPGAPTLRVRFSGVLGSLRVRTSPHAVDRLREAARGMADRLLRPPPPPPPNLP